MFSLPHLLHGCFFHMQNDFEYVISRGNEKSQFEMVKKQGVWALHFKRRLKHPGTFNVIIDSHPVNFISNDTWEKPLSLRLRLVVTQ